MTEIEALRIAYDELENSDHSCESDIMEARIRISKMLKSFDRGTRLYNYWLRGEGEFVCPVCEEKTRLAYDVCPKCRTNMLGVKK